MAKQNHRGTATHSFIHRMMHPPESLIELLLTYDTLGPLEVLYQSKLTPDLHRWMHTNILLLVYNACML